MKKYKFTIFTPTYNRGNNLIELYNSIITQKFKDFEWLIIDDGSTDNTKEIIEGFIKENKIKIRYIYKKNEGKSIAINYAGDLAKGQWIFIVDSDDRLTEDSLETIDKYCSDINDDENFAGVAGLKANSNKEIWQTFNPRKMKKYNITKRKEIFYENEFIDCTPIEYRYRYKISGDRAEVIRTSVLKKYKFPKFKNENFMPESYLWFSLSRDGYKIRWFNKVVYIAEYLEDGLTLNGKKISKKNSNSKCYLENFFLTLNQLPIKVKLKSSINYFRYGYYSGESYIYLFRNCNNKFWGAFGLVIAILYKIK